MAVLIQARALQVRPARQGRAAPVDASGKKLQGTVIGNRQLWQLAETTLDAVALVIEAAKPSPAIAELGVY
jgi:hypothetical protein